MFLKNLKKLNIFRNRKSRESVPSQADLNEIFRLKYGWFKDLLASNEENLNTIADIEEKLQGHQVFGMSYVRSQSTRTVFHTIRMVKSLNALSDRKYLKLVEVLETINEKIKEALGRKKETSITEFVLPYSKINKELVDWVGGKNANLGEVLNRVQLPIPEGFAITTYAFEYFLSHNDLVDEINKRQMDIDPGDPKTVSLVSEEIQRLIISARIPPEIEDALLAAYGEMEKNCRVEAASGSHLRVSLRSSAIGEDSDLSYAGQYLSVLNVPSEKLIQTYKYIVASLFTPRAISYRLNKGIRGEDVLMSVACLQMVDSVASGIVYSRHPFDVLQNNIIITGVWGLGPYAVGGVITPDTYVVSKDERRSILETNISHKPSQLVSSPEGGLRDRAVPLEKQDEPCLSPEQVRLLAEHAARLERHFRCPQDIEWALDNDDHLFILQTRPLALRKASEAGTGTNVPKLTGYPLLVEKGAVAFPGVGCGPAFHVHSEEDLLEFPHGAVLVAKQASPKFVIVMQKAQAIVTDFGSVTGHMASLAREFAIPTLLDAKVATTHIPQDAEVTVDAYTGRVYLGKIPELLALQKSRESHMQGTPVHETLKRVAEWIVPLHLVDPKSPSFAISSCRTLHDIMRFVHEVTYTEMFQISDMVSEQGEGSMKLDAHIPLDLYVIDLGEGLSGPSKDSRRVPVDQIVSIPFKAILKGMLHKDLVSTQPRPIEFKGFLSVMGQQMFSNPHVSERFGDRSYALISDKYVNFSSRVGYHYSVLDAYCGHTTSKNYITFSFKGGAADDIRRNRRARAIADILEALGFSVEVKGDRVSGRFQKYDQPMTKERLEMVGRLLQFTRQMDMLMGNEASVKTIAKCFLEGNYSCDLSSVLNANVNKPLSDEPEA